MMLTYSKDPRDKDAPPPSDGARRLAELEENSDRPTLPEAGWAPGAQDFAFDDDWS